MSDTTGPAGHGTFNQRKLVYVFIDNSLATPPGSGTTNSNIYNGVVDAINKWNNTADTGSCYGRPYTNYWFQLNQSNSSLADIKITGSTSLFNACGTTAKLVPYVITLPTHLESLDPYAVVSPIVQHELGHTIGLDEAYTAASGCSSINTIMNGVNNLVDCVPVFAALQSIDISQSNRNLTNENSCQGTWDNGQDKPTSIPCPQKINCGNLANIDTCTYGTSNDGCAWTGYLTSGPSGGDCCGGQFSPIIIDPSGRGFQLTSAENGVWFDFFGNGEKILMSWTAGESGNAWLVLDRNGNGTVDDATELFGDLTPQPPSNQPNGFAALAVFDLPKNGGNNNGVIDVGDAVFSKLRLWQDKNHNGISEPTELHTLSDLGIKMINLTYSLSQWVDVYGNQFRYKAPVSDLAPGTYAYDVFLVAAPRLGQ